MLGYSLAFGFLCSLDTFISQAYGAKCYKLMGLITQRAIIIMSIASIPVTFLWTKTGVILHVLLGIDHSTAHLAGNTCIYYILWAGNLNKFRQANGQQFLHLDCGQALFLRSFENIYKEVN